MLARLLILGEVGVYREALARALAAVAAFEVVGVAADVEEALAVLGRVVADVLLVDTRMRSKAR